MKITENQTIYDIRYTICYILYTMYYILYTIYENNRQWLPTLLGSVVTGGVCCTIYDMLYTIYYILYSIYHILHTIYENYRRWLSTLLGSVVTGGACCTIYDMLYTTYYILYIISSSKPCTHRHISRNRCIDSAVSPLCSCTKIFIKVEISSGRATLYDMPSEPQSSKDVHHE